MKLLSVNCFILNILAEEVKPIGQLIGQKKKEDNRD
jgi:hypothetical protein